MKPLIFNCLVILNTPIALFSQTKMLKTQAISIKINEVCWETSVKGGEEVTIHYSYKIFVPNVRN